MLIFAVIIAKIILPLLESTVAQISIAWLLHQPAVPSVVIGARTVSQLADNMKAALIKLTPQEVRGVSCRGMGCVI